MTKYVPEKYMLTIRKEMGLTQAEMARLFGVVEGTYARYEKSEFAGHQLPGLWRLALSNIEEEHKAGKKPIKPEIEQLPIGYTCGAAEFNAMKGQRGQWTKLQGTYTKTAMEAETNNTTEEG